MSDITEHDPQFVEDIHGAFNQLFKAGGMAVDQKGIERIQEISEKLAKAIEHRGEIKAIEVIRILQRSVTNAFKALESDIAKRNDELDEKLQAINARLDKLSLYQSRS